MRISDWSSDVCSSDLLDSHVGGGTKLMGAYVGRQCSYRLARGCFDPGRGGATGNPSTGGKSYYHGQGGRANARPGPDGLGWFVFAPVFHHSIRHGFSFKVVQRILYKSEEHTSELQSLMRISYA